MALVPKEIDDRIAALEERVALIEEALAPKLRHPEVHEAMTKKIQEEKEDVDSTIG